jgi:hypothetical protein
VVVAGFLVAALGAPAHAGANAKPQIKMTAMSSEGGSAVDFEAGVLRAKNVFVRLRDESGDTTRVNLSRDGRTEGRGGRWVGSTPQGGDPCRDVAFIAQNKHAQDSRRYDRVCMFGPTGGERTSRSLVWVSPNP